MRENENKIKFQKIKTKSQVSNIKFRCTEIKSHKIRISQYVTKNVNY